MKFDASTKRQAPDSIGLSFHRFFPHFHNINNIPTKMSRSTTPLEDIALKRFDQLVRTGDLLWNNVRPRHYASSPFDFEFRVAPSLISKPQDKEQKQTATPSSETNTKRGAFDDENPLFEISKIGPRHRLILNKFSVVRPQYVIPTNTFEPQRDLLNTGDIAAVWEVIRGVDSQHHIGIFNCGVEAGSSVGHKHLQVIPVPERNTHSFLTVLYDQILTGAYRGEWSAPDTIHSLVGAPFKHAAWYIPQEREVEAAELHAVWNRLCEAVGIKQGDAHNLLLTTDLIVAIPRRKAWMGSGVGEFAANAACMAGVVWCKTEDQYNAWMAYGPMRALREFGVDAASDAGSSMRVEELLDRLRSS
jgi:ATP adenylyltransferase/5',5'''-P-1,P-4-tetraphosphate phosphorylase II